MITINIEKAKVIAHAKRREARAEEFKPYDEVIMKQIPGTNVSAIEAAREAIRQKYVVMQTEINAATSIDEIKQAMSQG